MSISNSPQSNALNRARQRCNNPKQSNYWKYGGRGIECLLTLNQVQFLWKRDNADSLTKPSLDRRDPDSNYTLENCRFIEHRENSINHRPAYALQPQRPRERRIMTTHCSRGHLRDTGTLYVEPNGHVRCRTCWRENNERRKRNLSNPARS